jgi:hypothetical protein
MSFNCERRLSCLTKHRRVYTKTPTTPLNLECEVYQYLRCKRALLEFYNITIAELLQQDGQVKESKNSYNQINFIWYDQNGLRILSDSKCSKLRFNQSLTGFVNKLTKFKAINQGPVTCLANSQSTSMNQTDLTLLNWINLNSKANTYFINPTHNLLPPKAVILRLLRENIENLQFVDQSSFEDKNFSQHHESVSCQVEIVHDIDRNYHTLAFQSMVVILALVLFLVLVSVVLLYFSKSKKPELVNVNDEMRSFLEALEDPEEPIFIKPKLLLNSSPSLMTQTYLKSTVKSVTKNESNLSIFSETDNKSIISDLFSTRTKSSTSF